MSDDAKLNLLRLKLQVAEHIFKADSTHELLKRVLGDVWDDAVLLQGTDEHAARFLLSPVGFLGNKTPVDAVLSGDEGTQKYKSFLETLHIGFQ